MNPAQLAGLLDELEKISAAHGLSTISKSRKGRRPISVSKFLAKDKAGTLFRAKLSAVVDTSGTSDQDPGAARPVRKPGELPNRDYNLVTDGMPRIQALTGKANKKKGDLPSREDLNTIDRRDGRDNATYITNTGGVTVSGTGGLETAT